MPRRTNTRTAAQTQHLRYSLVLNKYILSLFGAKDFDTFCESLKDPRLEAYDSDNISLFYHEIVSKIPSSSPLTREQLLAYDANIYRHTKAISEKRQQKIAWKYFQYLSLLFTELYLDRYFSDRVSLLEDLNTYLNKGIRAVASPISPLISKLSTLSFSPNLTLALLLYISSIF